MGPSPAGYSIDRKNPDLGYSPENCRWANSHEQARTRTDNVFVEVNGTRMVLKDYASSVGVNYKALHARVRYRGQSATEAAATLKASRN